MRTVIIRITDSGADRPFQVQLLSSDSEDPSSKPELRAKAGIPRALTPEEEVRDAGGQPLTVARVREIYASPSDRSADFGPVGVFLYKLLARGKLRTEWIRLREEAPEGTRTILEIAQDEGCKALRDLPWERMYDPESTSHLFLEKKHTVVRGQASALDAPNPRVRVEWRKYSFSQNDWPLRILVVLGADAGSRPEAGRVDAIGAADELNQLEILFARKRFDVDWEVLEHPLPSEIVTKCELIQPHVLHFIGHGDAEGDPNQHCLKIWRPGKDGAEAEYVDWTIHDIRNDLQAIKPLRLAFLNACRTSLSAASARPAPFDGIVDAFVNLGALSVVGMQGNVPGDVAAAFSSAFYKAVLEGADVDVAAASARSSLSTLTERANPAMRSAWSYPVLRTRVLPSLVFPRRLAEGKKPLLAERFVMQLSQRRKVRDAVRGRTAGSAPGGQPSPHLVAIVGEAKTGKSHLAKWCAQLCERNGPRAAYIDLGEDVSWDIVDVLRCLRDGRIPSAGATPKNGARTPPLTAETARRLTWELNHRLRGIDQIPKLAKGVLVPDEGARLTGKEQPDEAFLTAIFTHFRLALEESAKPDGLLLVLDPISRVQEMHRQWLTNHLLRHIAKGTVPGVCAMVVSSKNDTQAWLDDLVDTPPGATVVELEDYSRSEFFRVARQLCRQWSPNGYDEVREDLPRIEKRHVKTERWRAGILEHVDELCRIFVDPEQS